MSRPILEKKSLFKLMAEVYYDCRKSSVYEYRMSRLQQRCDLVYAGPLNYDLWTTVTKYFLSNNETRQVMHNSHVFKSLDEGSCSVT